MMKRRELLARTGVLAGGFALLPRVAAAIRKQRASAGKSAGEHSERIAFETSDSAYQSTYSRALNALARNTGAMPTYSVPVLKEGSSYAGIWLECAPQEGLTYAVIHQEIARNNHLAFLALQREDGQLPGWIRATTTGFGQIQMVVPIAATAWELAQATGDSELLEKAYSSCARWDAWLRRYRDTRRTGLCEGFCTYDTGHDNSPRWAGIPNRCPDGDARKCPPVPSLPRLCPDLSATVYGGRVALASMARALGKNSEANRWIEDAGAIRSAIVERLYSAADAAFYDRDAQDQFVRVRGDAISRVLGEHVVDEKLFENIYRRQVHNPKAFWAPYPLPSIALDDPAFVRPTTRNSWAGAAQALTALRAPRWMEHYGKAADLAHLMHQWVGAILREGKFLQQIDPFDGTFTPDAGNYSPAALMFLDFTWRLSGVRKVADGLEWNVRPPGNGAYANYRLKLRAGSSAELRYTSGHARLSLGDKLICETSSTFRLVTDFQGTFLTVTGIASETTRTTLRETSGLEHKFSIEPNASENLCAPGIHH